jgi:glutaredoxin
MIIKLFTSSTCGDCKQIKRLLLEKDIPHKQYDVSNTDGLAEYAMLGVNCQRVPLLVVEKEGEVEVIGDVVGQLKFINNFSGSEKGKKDYLEKM